MSAKNCLIVVRIRVLSITQSDEKEKFKFRSIELDLICLFLDLTTIDRNRVIFIKMRVFCKFFEKSDANSF